MPAWLVSGEGSLPGLYLITFLLCPHVVAVEGKWRRMPKNESVCANSLVSLTRALIPSEGFHPMTSSKPCHLPKSPSLNTSAWELQLQRMNLGVQYRIQSRAGSDSDFCTRVKMVLCFFILIEIYIVSITTHPQSSCILLLSSFLTF